MGRFLLDTNIIIFLMTDITQIHKDVVAILKDFSNQKYVSSISLMEILQLHRLRKFKTKHKTAEDIIDAIKNDLYIEIISFTQHHAYTMAQLEVIEHHNDPMDHAIMAQAMSEHLTLVSSDRKMKEYIHQGLDFVWNKR